jgi:predicted Zn-dependent protease
MWREAQTLDQQMAESGALLADATLDAYCNSVAEKLLPGLTSAAPEVHVRVVASPFSNAFALPNGTLYVHTGMLAAMSNEAQLATVLGHELTHYVERHATEQQQTAQKKRRAGEVAATILAATVAGLAGTPDAATTVLSALNSAAQSVVTLQVLGYSRELESEADARGFDAMVAAGYDPGEAPAVFESLQRDLTEAGVQEPYFFGSHPRLVERVEGYRARLTALEAGGAKTSSGMV